MIRRLFTNRILAKHFLSTSNKLRIHFQKQLINKISYKLTYTFTPSFYFSTGSKKGQIKSAIEEITQFYRVYGWSDEFIQQSLRKLSQYERTEDWQSLFSILEFHLQKTQQNVGRAHPQYVTRLFQGIHYASFTGKDSKLQQWVNLLYKIYSQQNPSIVTGSNQHLHYQYEVAQLMGKLNNQKQAQKWLELFKNKFKNFDQTEQITDQQRFYTYLQLTEYYGYNNRNQQAVQYSKKTFDLIQTGKLANLQKQVQIAAIFNYGIAQYKFGDKQTGLKAFNLIEKTIDENKPNNFLLALNVCSSYSLVGLTQRGNGLLDKFQKIFSQSKNQDFINVYQNSIFFRIRIYLFYERYEKIYHSVNIVFEKHEQILPIETKFFYSLLKSLSQLKMGKKQDSSNSMKTALKIVEEHEGSFPKENRKDLLSDVQRVETMMKEQLNQENRYTLGEIKKLLMEKNTQKQL